MRPPYRTHRRAVILRGAQQWIARGVGLSKGTVCGVEGERLEGPMQAVDCPDCLAAAEVSGRPFSAARDLRDEADEMGGLDLAHRWSGVWV